jgi:EAL domain-containing protein (putative c-di-GMP-specific phosphodiesterase class I)
MTDSNGIHRRCSRCEVPPERLVGPGRLHLCRPPLGHTLGKTSRHLRSAGWICETAEDRRVVIRLDRDPLSDLFTVLAETLTTREMEDTRALFKPGVEGLSVRNIPRARSLKQLATLDDSGWLIDMLSEGRLTSHFQPIVQVDAPTEVYAQESLLRGVGVNGELVLPNPILEAARNTDMLFQVDLAARLAAVRETVRHSIEDNLFINFTPNSIYDPKFCLRSTVRSVDEASLDHERVVFEVTETEKAGDVRHLSNIIDYYRELGFKVALDDMGSGYSSLNLIHQLRPDFIKLDMELVRGVHGDHYKAVVAQKILEMAQSLGVETIVEGVESTEELG